MVKQRKKSKGVKKYRTKQRRKKTKRVRHVKKSKTKKQRGGLSAQNKQVIGQALTGIVRNWKKTSNRKPLGAASTIFRKPNAGSVIELLFPL